MSEPKSEFEKKFPKPEHYHGKVEDAATLVYESNRKGWLEFGKWIVEYKNNHIKHRGGYLNIYNVICDEIEAIEGK